MGINNIFFIIFVFCFIKVFLILDGKYLFALVFIKSITRYIKYQIQNNLMLLLLLLLLLL